MDRSLAKGPTRKSLSHTTYFRVEALFSLILSLTVLILLVASSMVSAADVINTEAVTIDEHETAASNVSGTEYINKLNTLKTKNETAVSNVSATEHMNKTEILNIDEKETATSNASATVVDKTETLKMNNETTAHKTHKTKNETAVSNVSATEHMNKTEILNIDEKETATSNASATVVDKTETLKMNNETTAHKTHTDDIPVPLPIPLTHHAVPLIARHNSHHVNVYIGTPPQRRLVIVDTGSRTLVVPCKPCTHCGHQHFSREFFDPKKSLTDIANHCNEDECKFVTESIDPDCPKSNECNFMLSYSEGSSIRGFELEDIVWLGTDNYEQSVKVHMQKAVPLSFGCESHETGIVADQYADGIMGLISESHKQDNIVDVMYRTGVIPNYAFSMCLTKTAGVLSLGGTALFEHHLEPMRMIPLTSSQYYTVSVKALYVGDVKIESKLVPDLVEMSFNEGRGAVVDSGTVRSLSLFDCT